MRLCDVKTLDDLARFREYLTTRRDSNARKATKKYLAIRDKVKSGKLCACGQKSVDKYKGKFLCRDCLIDDDNQRDVLDFLYFKTESSLRRCEDYAIFPTDKEFVEYNRRHPENDSSTKNRNRNKRSQNN
jgi:hypothetical protein